MSINTVKSFWNERPCNINHSKKPLGSLEYFEEVTSKKIKAEPHILEFADFEKYKDKEVLEIGCGIGTALISFLQAGAKVTAVELSDVSLDLARQRLDVYGLTADLYLGNAEELSTFLPFKKYDLIYSFGVIHHSPNPKKIIEQLSRYLKSDGGELKIMLYSYCSYKAFNAMHETNQWDMSTMRDTIRTQAEAQINCPIAFIYTFDEIRELLSPYFKVEKIWKDHIFIYDIPEYKKGNFIKSKPFENISDQELKKLEREMGWHTLCIASLT